MPRLLKFDVVHPIEFLEKKQSEWADLDGWDRSEYLKRLNGLRSNYSDFYTHHLNNFKDWEAEEYYLMDPVFVEKTAEFLFGKKARSRRLLLGLKKKLEGQNLDWENYVLHKYVEYFRPDVIFVRSQPKPSAFWQSFRNDSLLVSRLSARLPKLWHPNDWDIIYTDQPDFKTFFDLHGVTCIMNKQGFDDRIPEELKPTTRNIEISFVGGLGTQNFLQRTEFINSLALKGHDFKWWGYWWKYGSDGRDLSSFPKLMKIFQGPTSGLEMYQIYKDSKINFNDYVDTANNVGFNQRIFEVMGCGGFLLTREAKNFVDTFPADIFITYETLADCQDKIKYFLKNESERKEIAQAGQKFVLENYNYRNIVANFKLDLEKHLF